MMMMLRHSSQLLRHHGCHSQNWQKRDVEYHQYRRHHNFHVLMLNDKASLLNEANESSQFFRYAVSSYFLFVSLPLALCRRYPVVIPLFLRVVSLLVMVRRIPPVELFLVTD